MALTPTLPVGVKLGRRVAVGVEVRVDVGVMVGVGVGVPPPPLNPQPPGNLNLPTTLLMALWPL